MSGSSLDRAFEEFVTRTGPVLPVGMQTISTGADISVAEGQIRAVIGNTRGGSDLQSINDYDDLAVKAIRYQLLLIGSGMAIERGVIYLAKNVYVKHLSEPNVGRIALLDSVDQANRPFPSVASVRATTEAIDALVADINHARLKGWLYKTLTDAGQVPD